MEEEASSNVVLVVEDDPLLRMMLSAGIADEGYSVLQAPDVAMARRLLTRVQPKVHAVVTDLEMPGNEDGRDLAWNVYRHWPHTRIVVVSGKPNVQPEHFPPTIVFLAKPFYPEAIVRVLHDC